MLLGGDEFGRTQGGNNNAWCQDNEISWFDWDARRGDGELLEFTQRLIALRREHPVFRRRQFLHGTEDEGSGLPDVWWFRPDGRRMTKTRLGRRRRALPRACSSTARRSPRPDAHGERIVDDSFVLLFNARHEDVEFTLPPGALRRRVDAASCAPTSRTAAARYGRAEARRRSSSRSLVLLRRTAT